MNIEDLLIEAWPPTPGGMSTNNPQAGVCITHLPTNKHVICIEHRAQYKNKEQAMEELRRLVDEG